MYVLAAHIKGSIMVSESKKIGSKFTVKTPC